MDLQLWDNVLADPARKEYHAQCGITVKHSTPVSVASPRVLPSWLVASWGWRALNHPMAGQGTQRGHRERPHDHQPTPPKIQNWFWLQNWFPKDHRQNWFSTGRPERYPNLAKMGQQGQLYYYWSDNFDYPICITKNWNFITCFILPNTWNKHIDNSRKNIMRSSLQE